MKLLINCILYVSIALLTMQNHLIMAFLLVLLFTYHVGALWLLPLAFAIDGYFGAFTHVPAISIFAMLWFGVTEFVRPQLLMHNKTV